MLIKDLVITFGRVAFWTTMAWLLGLVLGYLAYRDKYLRAFILPFANLLRHISPYCWLPLIIIAFGIGEIAVGITLLFSLVFHSVIISMELFRSLPKVVMEQAKLDGAGSWRLFRDLELPLSMGGILDIYRVLWGVGWASVIAAEMLGVRSGMGYRLLDFRYLLRYKEMLGYIAVIGGVGIIIDLLLQKLKSRLVKLTLSFF